VNPLGPAYELIMVALCVWREARGEPYEAQVAIAHVIRNRMKDKRWPKTLSGVVLQPKQFSSFNSTDTNAVKFPKADEAAWLSCCKAACNGKEDPTGGANHYHTHAVTPKWSRSRTPTCVIGNHRFYKL
jgi:spore germination cell wall hydrolase CwlJ-like protein